MSAMLGAIEIYNKPRFAYRDEVFVILLINAWELALKAITSKSGQSVYYKKRRGEPYRTISLRDAFWRAANSKHWPPDVEFRAVEANLDLLSTYRDSAIHFYNDPAFSTIVYALAQTSILNFRDVVTKVFGKDIADEVSWSILPLGTDNPIDPIEFMKGKGEGAHRSRAAQEFLAVLKEKANALSSDGIETSRLITIFSVTLQSTKKVTNADVVAGITRDDLTDALIVSKSVDPNVSHPYRQKDVLPKLINNTPAFTFQAIVFAYNLRDQARYCWKDNAVSLVRWSPEVITFVNNLTEQERQDAVAKYSARYRQ